MLSGGIENHPGRKLFRLKTHAATAIRTGSIMSNIKIQATITIRHFLLHVTTRNMSTLFKRTRPSGSPQPAADIAGKVGAATGNIPRANNTGVKNTRTGKHGEKRKLRKKIPITALCKEYGLVPTTFIEATITSL
jgi:hypothetical protein